MKIRLFLLLFFSLSSLQAQDIYVVNSTNAIYIVNVATLQVTELFTVDISQAGYLTDIAFAPDGRFFGVTNGWKLIEIDIPNQTFSFLADLPVGDPYTALVCNAQGQLLTSRTFSEQLYAYDLSTSSLSMLASGISSPGDFTFYKGNLVYPNILNDFVKAYDGSNITNVGCSIPFLYSFVNNFEDCLTSSIYAFDQFANLYNFDLETENYELIADLFNELGLVNGAATQTEWMASVCPPEMLEPVICNPLGTENFRQNWITLKSNPVEGSIDFDITIAGEIAYSFHSVEGRLLLEGKVENNSISVSQLRSGIYFLRLIDPNGKSVFEGKIIKN